MCSGIRNVPPLEDRNLEKERTDSGGSSLSLRERSKAKIFLLEKETNFEKYSQKNRKNVYCFFRIIHA